MRLNRIILFFLLFSLSINYLSAEDKDARRREFIKEFINDYKIAYQKENISYIEDFFSNDALIVTETRKLCHAGSEMIPNSSKSRSFHSIIENRKEYIARLKSHFAKNGHITLGISNLLIKRHSKYPEIYGVHFFQIWNDVGNSNILENKMPGYIFMMIDFKKNEKEPTIHVRTWQPKANILKPSDKYTLTDFRIIPSK